MPRTPLTANTDQAHEDQVPKPFTKRWASRASSIQSTVSDSIAAHSFILRPCPGSNGSALPSATSSSTRALGIFTTKRPLDDTNAKSFPFTLRPVEPNPLPPCVTLRSLAKAAITRKNREPSLELCGTCLGRLELFKPRSCCRTAGRLTNRT